MSSAGGEFLRRAAVKAADPVHRQILRTAISVHDSAVAQRRKHFRDWEAARQRCYEIKWEALNHLDRYLPEFERRVVERGGRVFWAEDAKEARQYIAGLAARCGARIIVKSKSMVTEEIQLGAFLENRGINVVETDLGEFIVQLRHEPPSHIVTPAMHLTRAQIAALFKEKLEGVHSDEPEELVAAARRALRPAFLSAEMGITGANFLVADAGLVAITTNEGNARLCSALPRIHVVVTGIEKVIPRLQDLAVLWPVLAASGTGQHLTCYNTLIGGPRLPGENDGPEEFHVVLLDNGRSALLAEPELRDVLHCIRCGACLNACPVFQTVGGHAYGTTYSGPIGSVLTPRLLGMHEFHHLSYASSLCGACTEACPVKIDLHHHLLHNRRDAVSAHEGPWGEKAAFRLWRWTMISARRFAFVGWAVRICLRLLYRLGLAGSLLDPARPWTRNHAALPTPTKSFRALWRKSHGAG